MMDFIFGIIGILVIIISFFMICLTWWLAFWITILGITMVLLLNLIF